MRQSELANEGEGGIWQAAAVCVSDGTHLYVMTGNGDFDASVGDYGDSFLETHARQQHAATNKNGYGLSVYAIISRRSTSKPFPRMIPIGSGGPMLLPDQAWGAPALSWSVLARVA